MSLYILKKKLIAFDLDGTLIDSMPWYAEVATQLLVTHYSLPKEQAKQEYYRTSGIPFRKQLEELFPHHPLNEAVAAQFEQQKKDFLYGQGFDLTASVCMALEQLQNKGIKIAISTSNSPENLAVSINRWPVQFDAVLGYEGEHLQKGLSHFQWLADHFDVDFEEMAFVGDSLDDYRLAHAAQVDFIAILGSFTAAQFHSLDPSITCVNNIHNLLT